MDPLIQEASIEDIDRIILGISLHATKETTLPFLEEEKLHFAAKDKDGKVLGGIKAKATNWGLLHVQILFVFDAYRGQKIASKLLKHVEEKAKELGCHLAYLSTYDFQAKDFYLKNGYSIFGVLENAPKGHTRYYLKKDL